MSQEARTIRTVTDPDGVDRIIGSGQDIADLVTTEKGKGTAINYEYLSELLMVVRYEEIPIFNFYCSSGSYQDLVGEITERFPQGEEKKKALEHFNFVTSEMLRRIREGETAYGSSDEPQITDPTVSNTTGAVGLASADPVTTKAPSPFK